jgi:hypothetical protein
MNEHEQQKYAEEKSWQGFLKSHVADQNALNLPTYLADINVKFFQQVARRLLIILTGTSADEMPPIPKLGLLWPLRGSQ